MFTINRRGQEPLRISLPDFNKAYRCPGWSGEGMRGNKVNWCNDDLPPGVWRWSLVVRRGARPPEGVEYATDLPGFYSWRVRRTNCCNTIVLPQFLYLLTPGAWFCWLPGGQRQDGTRYRGSLRPGSAWHTAWWQWRRLRRFLFVRS